MLKMINLLMIVLLSLSGCIGINFLGQNHQPLQEFTLEGQGQNKVLVIPINGVISSKSKKGLLHSRPGMVRQIVTQLQRAEKDKDVRAVLLKINSPGGTVTASDLLYHEILNFKKRSKVKIVAMFMNTATSGAYYLALPADVIIAHPTTVTGSIGVIFMRPRAIELMNKIGLEMLISKSGANKDMLSPFRKSTPEEETILQDLIDALALRFSELVRQHRSPDKSTLEIIKSARIFLGPDAQKIGLVDHIGYLNDGLAKAKKIAGLSADARVVIYRHQSFSDDNIYNNGAALLDRPTLIQTGLPPILTSMPTGFYYIWQPGI